MDTKIAVVGVTPETALPANNATPSAAPAPPANQPAPAPAPAPAVVTGPDPADMRLVIDRDPSTGSYVYKTVNRRTGEVVQQLPRAEVLKMRHGADYSAGDVVSTKA